MTKVKNSQYNEIPTKENIENDSVEIPSTYGLGIRHVQVILAGLALTISFLARSHIGVTIVAMTNIPHANDSSNVNGTVINNIARNNTTVWEDMDYDNVSMIDDNFGPENVTATESSNLDDELINDQTIMKYDWPKSVQEMILGSFFLGYSIMMFPMGMVGQRWGGKVPMQISLLFNGLASIFTPWLMTWGSWKAVCACRLIQGFSQAGLVSGIQITVSRWSSPNERGRFITYVYTGTTFGTIIAFQLAGFLAASSWGWPSTFWAVGGICLIMFALVTIFGSVSPAEHKSISEEERNYIMGKAEPVVKRNRRVPWKAILTSKAVWATVPTHIGSGLSFIFFFNQAPSYIHYILDMDVKKSGLLSSLPYASNVIMNIVYGLLSDFLTNRKILSVQNSRRLFNSISQFGVAISFIAVSYTKNIELAVGCMVLAMGAHAAIHCGWMVNHIDLASNYAGILMAAGNTVTCSMSVLIPVMISFIVTDVTNQYQWRKLFLFMGSLSFITNAIFVIFMTSESQPWNESGYEETDTDDKIECDKKLTDSQKLA